MSIQQSVNQIASNIEWAGRFFAQSPEAKDKLRLKQAKQNRELLKQKDDTFPTIIDEEIARFKKRDPEKYANMTPETMMRVPEVEKAIDERHNAVLTGAEQSAYRVWQLEPTAENYGIYSEAREDRRIGKSARKARDAKRAEEIKKQKRERQDVLEDTGEEILNRAEQQNAHTAYRKQLENYKSGGQV